jgi:murein DD-endopeptidase MepM/ murein hydrolase activator NlpD
VRSRLLKACALIALAALAVALPGGAPLAQTAYRHRDASGQWVYTDGAAGAAAPAGDSISFVHEPEALHITVERSDTDSATALIAANGCLCVVTLRVSILQSDFAAIPKGATYQATLEPGARKTLVEARRSGSAQPGLRFTFTGTLGSPDAVHHPAHPYRAPFAVGATFNVTQAFPSHVTHVTPDSRYAVDFALPDGTPVYAAREGVVVNVRHDSFRGGAQTAMLDQANLIMILHEDGTIGAYGHLQWDSIRVRIGQHVKRGEYIANSGNTGFTTGPHLHFAVLRNAGTAAVSVPIEFAGIGGVAVTPTTDVPLTAY